MASDAVAWRKRQQEFAPFAAEFIGTFFLIFTISLCVLQKHPLAPFSAGFMLAAMVFTSGGHFNPAVTLGVWLSARSLLNLKTVSLYAASQLFGATLATLLSYGLLGTGATFSFEPAIGHSWVQAAIVEVVYSGALVFVVLCCATLAQDTRSSFQDDFAGLAIGLALVGAAFACGTISGCCLNPALALGASGTHSLRVGADASFKYIPLYVVCPLLGAVASASLFRLIRFSEYDYKVMKVEKERREGGIPKTPRDATRDP